MSLFVNVESTIKELALHGLDTRTIYTGHGNPEDRLAIVKSSLDGWAVYYSERGETYEFQEFMEESLACAYLVKLCEKYGLVK